MARKVKSTEEFKDLLAKIPQGSERVQVKDAKTGKLKYKPTEELKEFDDIQVNKDGIPVTMIGGSYFTKPGGMKTKWPNDGAIQLRSALGTETPDAVVPHRACFSFPLTHSLFVSKAVGAADDTALTWNPESEEHT